MASATLFGFVPPACAISGRPPPPWPSSTIAAAVTISTALYLPVKSFVTPTTMDTLPSNVATAPTMPEPIFFYHSSTMGLSSLAGTSCKILPMTLTPLMTL